MSKQELIDNFSFLSALAMMKQLVEQGFLTAEEGEQVKDELNRTLRPTLILA